MVFDFDANSSSQISTKFHHSLIFDLNNIKQIINFFLNIKFFSLIFTNDS